MSLSEECNKICFSLRKYIIIIINFKFTIKKNLLLIFFLIIKSMRCLKLINRNVIYT